jgi:hypothetical protein
VASDPGKGSDERAGSRPRGRLAELGPGWISAIGTLVAAVAAAAGLLVTRGSGDHGTSTAAGGSTTTAAESPRAPAPSPPAVALCSGELQIAVDGTAGPLTCDGGALNTRVWDYYAKLTPFVMALRQDATPGEVRRAMCADLAEGNVATIPQETEIYRITALYNHWNFSLEPTDSFPDYCRSSS